MEEYWQKEPIPPSNEPGRIPGVGSAIRSRGKALRKTVKQVQASGSREEALKLLPTAQSVIDRSARRHIISQSASRRLKSRLAQAIATSE